MICVLVVDDRPDARLAFAFLLDALGCAVAEAASTREALTCLGTHGVDVVLVDIRMADGKGIDLIEAIRRRPPPHPKIIAMTGKDVPGGPASLEATGIAGADAVAFKPVSRECLLTLISQLTDGSVGPETDNEKRGQAWTELLRSLVVNLLNRRLYEVAQSIRAEQIGRVGLRRSDGSYFWTDVSDGDLLNRPAPEVASEISAAYRRAEQLRVSGETFARDSGPWGGVL